MKKIYTLFSALCLAAAAPGTLSAQNNFKLVEESVSNPDNTPAPVYPVPSERQLKWNETEFYAFFHYGMNTYTNEEWGSGMEYETTFAPTQKPDPKQWLEVAQKAGMRGGIAVVKHHDGFCLWPTATTEHCTRNSSGYGKNVDIPKEFAEAARALKMKYGFYISPWDMSSQYWGKKDNNGNYTDEYAKLVFLPQCAELAKYGDDQFEMWFDGATGGEHAGGYGSYTSSQKRTIDNAQTYYDIPNLRDSIHNLLPNVIMWGVGGEARWIGNEDGVSGETCWSMGDAESGIEDAWQWAAGESDAKSKVIILLTDGVNNRGEIAPVMAAEIAKEQGIRVYTIGVGSRGTAPTPAIDMFGNMTFVQAKVEIDEKTLQEIADATGGRYFRATDNEKLRAIYDEINRLEKSKVEVADFTTYTEEYLRWVLAALALLAAEFLIRTLILKRIP